MPGIQVDGNDILAMVAASKEAVERARSGEGPTLIEAVTYRMSVHTTADDPKRYRTDEEVDSWREKDPLTRYARYLSAKKLLDDEQIETLEGEVKEEIQTAVDGAEEKMKSMGDPIDMFDHVYEQRPSYLEEQRKALARALSQEENHG
jgi:pyruvate dehydrogenase E1 component alpha subunit